MLPRRVNPRVGRRTDVNSRRIAAQINLVHSFANNDHQHMSLHVSNAIQHRDTKYIMYITLN